MNDNTPKNKHVPKQGVDHLPGQLDLIEHAKEGAPDNCFGEQPFEPLPENVKVLKTITSLDLPVNRILQQAHDAGLSEVLVLGYTKDGKEYFAASVADGAENIWLMERAKHNMMKVVDGDDN